MPASGNGGSGGSPDAHAVDAASAAAAAEGAADSAAPRTPPMVLLQRSVTMRDEKAEDAASGSDVFDDARSWGGSPQSSVMSAYYSPRRADSEVLVDESPPIADPPGPGPTAASSAPVGSHGAELMQQHALRRQQSAVRRRVQRQREQLSLRTAGPARVRSFDIHPAMRSALAAAHEEHTRLQEEHTRLILPAAEPGALPGVMPLAEPLLASHRPVFAGSGDAQREEGPPRLHAHSLLHEPLLQDADGLVDELVDAGSEGESSEDEESAALEDGNYGTETWAEYKQEGARLFKMAWPLAAQNVFSQGSFYISMAFAGQLGRDALSAAVLGTSILNVTGFAALAGLASAMETLCGQAYGAKNYAAVGVTLQRALLICLVALAALLPLWIAMEPVLLALGQKPQLAADAARFVQLSVPAVFFTGVAECLKRYLMAQGVVFPAAVASLLSTLLAPVFNYVLVFSCGFGLAGAAFANDAIFLTTALLLGGWVIWYDHAVEGRPEDTWQGWSFQCFRGWGNYIAIAAPSCVMVCMEWWSVECIVMLSGLLRHPSLSVAVTGICLNLMALVYMMSFGFSGASSTRVSNALGAGRPRAARRTARVSGVLSVISTSIAAALILVFRNKIALMFTHDRGVVDAVAAMCGWLAIVVVGDGLNAVYSGVIRGAARQKLGVAVNLGAYWVFGIPLAVFLAFPAGWGVHGLWVGMAVTTTVQGSILTYVSLRLDWAAEARRAAALLAMHSAFARETEPPAPQHPHKEYSDSELDV